MEIDRFFRKLSGLDKIERPIKRIVDEVSPAKLEEITSTWTKYCAALTRYRCLWLCVCSMITVGVFAVARYVGIQTTPISEEFFFIFLMVTAIFTEGLLYNYVLVICKSRLNQASDE